MSSRTIGLRLRVLDPEYDSQRGYMQEVFEALVAYINRGGLRVEVVDGPAASSNQPELTFALDNDGIIEAIELPTARFDVARFVQAVTRVRRALEVRPEAVEEAAHQDMAELTKPDLTFGTVVTLADFQRFHDAINVVKEDLSETFFGQLMRMIGDREIGLAADEVDGQVGVTAASLKAAKLPMVRGSEYFGPTSVQFLRAVRDYLNAVDFHSELLGQTV